MGAIQNVITLSMFTVLAASEFETQKITRLSLGIWSFENVYIGTKSTQGENYQSHYQSKYNNWDKTPVGWKLLPFSSPFFWFTLSNRNTYPNAHLSPLLMLSSCPEPKLKPRAPVGLACVRQPYSSKIAFQFWTWRRSSHHTSFWLPKKQEGPDLKCRGEPWAMADGDRTHLGRWVCPPFS